MRKQPGYKYTIKGVTVQGFNGESDQVSFGEVFSHFYLDLFCHFAGYPIEVYGIIGKDNTS
jgi:hypothetical protein